MRRTRGEHAAGLRLEARLPNPPPIFVGRREETARLDVLIGRAPIALVSGASGIGKTATVAHVLHKRYATRARSTVYRTARPGDATSDLLLTVVDALEGATRGPRAPKADDVATSPQALAAAAIDLAEAAQLWVVLDELEHLPPGSIEQLATLWSRYARESRLICIGRDPLRIASLAEQALDLGPMVVEELDALAREILPRSAPPDLPGKLAIAARGSPWLLRQLCVSDHASEVATHVDRPDLLRGLPAGARDLVSAAILVDEPLPMSAVRAALGESSPSDREIDALVERGVFERSGDTVRATDAARALLVRSKSAEGRQSTTDLAVRILDGAREPRLAIERVRLLFTLDRRGDAIRELAISAVQWIAAGHAALLWRAVEGTSDPLVERWRLAAGVALGDASILRGLRLPPSPDFDDRVCWAQCLFLRGDLEAAAEEAGALAALALRTGEAERAFEAGVLHARSLMNLGRMSAALDVLRALRPAGADAEVRRDTLVASCLVVLGSRDDALALAAHIQRRLSDVSPALRVEVTRRVARVFFDAGLPREAADLLDAITRGVEPGRLLLLSGRQILLLYANVLTDIGRFADARAVIAQLRAAAGPRSIVGMHVRGLELSIDAFEGERADVLDRLRELREDARRSGAADFECVAVSRLLQLAIWERMRLSEADLELPDRASPHYLAYAELARRSYHARRRAPPAPLSARAEAVLAGGGEPAIVSTIVQAEISLIDGESALALETARHAAGRAGDLGFALHEASARAMECDALVVLSRPEELATAAGALARLSVGAARVEAEARFYRLAAADGPPSGADLEALALAAAGRVARNRARALLGGTPPLDAVDEIVLDALEKRGWRRARAVCDDAQVGHDWTEGWGLDEERLVLWIGGSRTVPMREHPVLWRMLLALARAGGRLDKDALVRSVWSEPSYDPRLHDNKLRLAVRKVRTLLEDDPARPRRLLTVPEGYVLGGAARLIASRHPTTADDIRPRGRAD